MGWRGVLALVLGLSGLMSGVQAQPWQSGAWRTDWWRNGATLDMDFAKNRYMVSLTAPVTYTSLTQFISAVSGTFTRPGANETATEPFYLGVNQSFVSRAASTTQITATGNPFYADASQAFYSRASTGTYFDSSGVMQTAASNVARPDYDPVTHAYNGILIEEARTNLVSSSQDFSTSSWVRASILNVSNTGVLSPDGVSYAPKFADSYAFTSAKPYVRQTVDNLAVNATYTVSLFAKAGEYSYLELQTYNGSNNKYPIFNIANGTLEQANGVGSYNVRTMGNGWYRISYPFTTTSTGTSATIALYSHFNNNNAGYDGTTNSGIYLWGVQLEKGYSPTSYIATSGSTVTRAADVYTQETASYFNSAGILKYATAGAARADYHPSTLAYRGILAEPARTNLIPYSADISGSNKWQQNGSPTLIFNTPSPDGGLAYAISSTAAFSGVYKGGTLSVTPGASYTETVFVKNISGSPAVRFGSDNVNAAGVGGRTDIDINTLTGSVTSLGAGVESYSVSPASNGWFRVAIGFTAATSSYSTVLYNSSALSSVNAVWGIQLEKGSSPTSYIPTSGTPASRAADVYTSGYSGTYFDASGTLRNAPANTPRLDYDPSTSAPKGVLIEEARTNVAPSDITASPWLSYGTVTTVSNSDLGPDGTMTAHRITCGTANCNQYLNMSGVSGTTYTFSFFTKAPSGGGLCHRGRSGTAVGGGVTYFSTSVGNGWTRHGFTETVVSPGTWLPQIINYNTIGKSCIVWGPQVEVGAFPTSYIPTSASSVTRAADVFSVPTGAWYNPSEWTALVAADHFSAVSQTAAALVLYDVNNVNCHRLALAEDSLGRHSYRMMVSDDCSVWDGRDADVIGSGLFSMGAAIKDGDSVIGAHGTVFEATSVPMAPNLNTMSIGSSGGYASFWNRPIRRVTYFPTRQPDYSLPDYTR